LRLNSVQCAIYYLRAGHRGGVAGGIMIDWLLFTMYKKGFFMKGPHLFGFKSCPGASKFQNCCLGGGGRIFQKFRDIVYRNARADNILDPSFMSKMRHTFSFIETHHQKIVIGCFHCWSLWTLEAVRQPEFLQRPQRSLSRLRLLLWWQQLWLLRLLRSSLVSVQFLQC
jgi:hypothetical protein